MFRNYGSNQFCFDETLQSVCFLVELNANLNIIFSKEFIYVSLIDFQIVLSINKYNTISKLRRETSQRKRYCSEYDKNAYTKDVEQKQTESTKLSIDPELPIKLVDEKLLVHSHSLPILSTTFSQSSFSIKSQSCPFIIDEISDECIDVSTYI